MLKIIANAVAPISWMKSKQNCSDKRGKEQIEGIIIKTREINSDIISFTVFTLNTPLVFLLQHVPSTSWLSFSKFPSILLSQSLLFLLFHAPPLPLSQRCLVLGSSVEDCSSDTA